jgi:flavin-dependent dehydrogenase
VKVVDAIVVGAGPAGSAAAITLAQAGWCVRLFGRAATDRVGARLGESLSPAGPRLLARLGLADALQHGHLRCHGNAFAWGTDSLAWNDFIRDPRGSGFHVDRDRLDAQLRARAADAGVCVIEAAAPRDAELTSDGWRVGEIVARWVIDASGRACGFARARGARREHAWDQVAITAFARVAAPIQETFSLVEAVRDGFWYSAPAPGGRFALAFFTDARLHDPRAARTDAGFAALLAGAPHTRRRLDAHDAAFDEGPCFVDAGSARLVPVHGTGWVAVGDAALAYDPIAAHGVTLALRTGIDAAVALIADVAGDNEALDRYSTRLEGAFSAYRGEARRIYAAEQRWRDAPYWRARHAL